MQRKKRNLCEQANEHKISPYEGNVCTFARNSDKKKKIIQSYTEYNKFRTSENTFNYTGSTVRKQFSRHCKCMSYESTSSKKRLTKQQNK